MCSCTAVATVGQDNQRSYRVSYLLRPGQRPGLVGRGRRLAQHRYPVAGADIRLQPHFRAQGSEQRAMRNHEHRERSCQRAVHGTSGAHAQLRERFGALRRGAPRDPIGEPFGHRLAFALAIRGFVQLGLKLHRQAQNLRHDPRGDAGARQRRGHDRSDAAAAEAFGRGMRLREAVGVQRNVQIALGQVTRVPVGLAMAQEPIRLRPQAAQDKPSCCNVRCTEGRASMRSKCAAQLGGRSSLATRAAQYST